MAANTQLVTFNNFPYEVEKYYFSPILRYSGGEDFSNLYFFISAKNDWADQNDPPTPENTHAYLKSVHKNINFLKKINSSDICPIIERIDWKPNFYYETYSDTIDIFQRDSVGKFKRKFYVRNSLDQVFKCIWNNVNYNNTLAIANIATSGTTTTVKLSDTLQTFNVGSYVTIIGVNPKEYDGTYLVISSAPGMANLYYSTTTAFSVKTKATYVTGSGKIKQAILSTQEPVFDIGTFDENQIVKTSDGYKWKYIYTIDQGLKQKFFDKDWMPVPVRTDILNPYLTSEKFGCIEAINVLDGGTNYANGYLTTAVTVTGDGRGAAATAYVNSNKITEILMTNKGYDYTYANVAISPAYGYTGSGAKVELSISPIGGHGFSPMREFACDRMMVTCELLGTEGGKIPAGISYNQIGLLNNPYVVSDPNRTSNTSVLSGTTDILVTKPSINYVSGELLYQGTSLSTASFVAEYVAYYGEYILNVINTSGAIQPNYPLIGATSGAISIILAYDDPNLVKYSGDIIYLENRKPVVRNALDSEQFRLILKF